MATTKELEDELAQAKTDIKALAAIAADRAKLRGNGLASGMETLMASLSDDARTIYETAAKEGVAYRGAFEDQVRTNPLAATGIAFGIGVIFASLMRR